MTTIKNGTLLVKDSNGNTARVATLSQTDITTLNTALTDIDANKRKISSISANYVTTNTAQTITGKKTLTTTNKAEVIAVKVTNTDSTVTPTENLWTNVISVYDKNTKNAGNLQFSRQPDGSNWVKLQAANQNANGNNIYHVIGIGLKADGTASTSAPKPASNSNDNNIATTSWVNDKVNPIKNNYVTTNTAQNITAIKTIVLPSNQHAIIVKDTGTDNKVTPASKQWQSMIIAVDKNNKERGCVQATLDTNGYSRTKLMAIQQDSNGNNIYNNLELAIKPDGTRHTYVSSSPSSNSNDTSIATTAWVNAKISASATSINSNKVTTNTNQTISGAKTFTNAIIAPDIELTAPYPFIDFHFNNSTADFTSRIIAEANAYLHCSGTFAADTFKSLSDKNYKKDITSVSYDLSKLKSYRYKFKNDKSGSWHVGLIAQEVQEIIPEAVTKTKTKDSDYLTLDYNAIVAALVTEVNQLKKRIEVLENK